MYMEQLKTFAMLIYKKVILNEAQLKLYSKNGI